MTVQAHLPRIASRVAASGFAPHANLFISSRHLSHIQVFSAGGRMMDKNQTEELPTLKKEVTLIYALGCIFWFATWYFIGGYSIMNNLTVLWFPFVFCIIVLISNALLWAVAPSYKSYEEELSVIQFVERHAGVVVTAITASIFIGFAISAIKTQAPLPEAFILFQSAAFISAFGGVLPLFWIPSNKVHWLVMLRHIKTVPFSFAISLFLGGLIILLGWL